MNKLLNIPSIHDRVRSKTTMQSNHVSDLSQKKAVGKEGREGLYHHHSGHSPTTKSDSRCIARTGPLGSFSTAFPPPSTIMRASLRFRSTNTECHLSSFRTYAVSTLTLIGPAPAWYWNWSCMPPEERTFLDD